MSKLKRMLLTFVASLGLIAPAAIPLTAHAAAPPASNDIIGGFCAGVENNAVGAAQTSMCLTGDVDEQSIITKVINFLSLVVGFVAVVMIIVGGFKYITSGGDSGNVTGAKNTILYAIVGIIIVVLAQVIIRFVINQTAETTTGL